MTTLEMLDEIERLNAKVKELQTPEWYSSPCYPEFSDPDITAHCEGRYRDEVVQLFGAREVCHIFCAYRVLTVDEHGEPDDGEWTTFNTSEEAHKSYLQSLTKARKEAALNTRV